MFSRIYGAVLFGLNGCLITVETDIANGLPSFDIVGLATVAVKEAKERVRTAVKNSGLAFPESVFFVTIGQFPPQEPLIAHLLSHPVPYPVCLPMRSSPRWTLMY